MKHQDRHVWRFDQMAINVNDRIDNPAEADVEHYVGLEHLDPDSLKIRRWGVPSDVEATKLLFKKGDIIFGRRRAYQRKLAVADFDGICSAHAMVLRARPDVALPEFLPFFMQSDLFMNRAVEISVGSLSPTINWKMLAAQEFALPPLEEQRRIAEVLVTSYHALDAYRSCEQISHRQYLSLVLHLFQNGIESRQHLEYKYGLYPQGWVLRKVGECFELQLGKMSSAAARQSNAQLLYLKNNNVLWGAFDFSSLNSMSFNDVEREKYALRDGDLLVCEGGEIGRAAVWHNEYPGLLYQKALHRLRPRNSQFRSNFLMHYLRFCSLRGVLQSISTGTTIPHLPSEQLAELTLAFPSVDEQDEIVNILSNVWVCYENVGKRTTETLEFHRALLSLALGSSL